MLMKKSFPLIALIVATIIWGTTFIVLKNATTQISPALAICFRGLITCIVLFGLCFKKLKVQNKMLLLLNITTGIVIAFAYITQTIGLKYTTSAKCAFLENVYIVVVPLLTWLLTRNRPSWISLMCCAICTIGVVVISIGDNVYQNGINVGDILSIVGGALFGVNIVLTGIYFKEKDPLPYTFYQFVTVTIICLVYSLIFERTKPVFNTAMIINVLYLGLFATATAWLLRNYAQNKLSPLTIGIVLPFTSVISTVISICIGETKFSITFLIGGILIFVSILTDVIGNYYSKKVVETE